jgi:hypothetical protein
MRIPRLAGHLFSYAALGGILVSMAAAQTTNYSSIEVTADQPVQLSYHASAHKSTCEPAPAPQVHVIQPPRMGSLIVRKAMLRTDKIAGCPGMNVPARVVFYNAKEGYTGEDKVKYEAISASGEVTTYEVTLTIKPSTEKPSKPGKTDGTNL